MTRQKRYHRRRFRDNYRKMAIRRLNHLFQASMTSYREGETDLAREYVQMARKIAMKARIHIPRRYKLNFCKNCDSLLIPSRNLRIRLGRHNRNLRLTCGECGTIRRIPYAYPRK